MRSAPGRPRAAVTTGPHTSARNASRPSSAPSAMSSRKRAATAAGLVSDSPPEPARIGGPSAALPTANTNADDSACESSERTRRRTV